LIRAVVLEQDVRFVRDIRRAGVSELLSELSAEACGGEFDVFDGGFAHKNGGTWNGGRQTGLKCHESKLRQELLSIKSIGFM
jgi:hypothetical protein